MTSTESPKASAERWGLVTARDIMQTNVVTVNYASPLSDVERILGDHRISGAPVTDEGGHIVGIISLKDLIERYAEDPASHPRREQSFYHLSANELQEQDFVTFDVPKEAEETARDIMSGEVYSVGPMADLREIAAEMVKHGVHRVLVQEDGKYVGLISTMEILKSLSD